MKANQQGKLSHKFIMGFLILGVMICASTCYIGYNQYKGTIEKMYNENAYLIAEVAASYIDGNTVANYWQTQAVDAAYEEMASRIDTLFAVSQATYIYLYIPTEDYQCLNLYDASKTPLGATYGMAVEDPEKVLDIYRSGQRTDDYFIRKSEWGYNTAAVEPIKNSAGETTALLTVDISMGLIQGALRQYVLSAIAISCLLVAIFIATYLFYLRRNVIKPLSLITWEADRFIEERTHISTQLETINTRDEIQSLAQTIHRMQVDINDYIDNLTRVTAEKERIGAELSVATHIQANMLPSIFPPYPDRDEFDLYATMTPAKEVGGDFYDFFLVDSDHLALVMADVSGKGVPAALFMVIAKTMLKNSAQTGLSPSQVLEKVNNQLCENNDAEMFVTVWLGILELSSGRMVCANAGHEYPALRRQGHSFELVMDKHGFVLAGLENARYREYELELHPGDQLYVYTDGVAEATDANNELFGTERMLTALNSRANVAPQELLQAVKVGIDGFVREAPQFDDITMLALTYRGSQA